MTRRERREKAGPARRHWGRRRRGQVNSAPNLKHRSASEGNAAANERVTRRGNGPAFNERGQRVSGRRSRQGVVG